MKNVPTLQFIWKQTMKAINAFNRMSILIKSVDVQNAINNSDDELATSLIKEFQII